MTAAAVLSIPTFVAGPENEGRGYGVLARSDRQAPASWTIDLPMILFEWAKLERTAPFVACLPIGDDLLAVVRARFFRRLPIGHVSYLNGALLDLETCRALDWRTELVAAAVPDPDETLAFANAPLALATPPGGPVVTWPELGLAWANRLIAVDPPRDAEDILHIALRSIDPPEQRRRVLGWTTSIELVARGAINPLRQCQLAVVGGAAPDIAGFAPMRVLMDDTTEGDVIAPPTARAMWEQLHASLATLPELAGPQPALQWQAEMTDSAPRDVAMTLLRGATGLLSPGSMTALLHNLLMRGRAELREPGTVVLEEYIAALAQDAPVGLAVNAIAQLAPLLAIPVHAALAHRLIDNVSASGLHQAPSATLAELLQLAINLLRPDGRTIDTVDLRPLAEIAIAYSVRCDVEGLPLAPLGEVVDLWPAEAADMIDALVTASLVKAIARRGRDVLAAATRKLIQPLGRRPRFPHATRDDLLRKLGALLTAIRLMEEASD